ncbi:MAG TPA: tetratricopeptide repeat protein [Nitrospira sp.]
MTLSFLLVSLCLSTSTWTLDQSWSVQTVSSARKLNGDELLRIGEIHDVQNHFPEALTYYEQAVETFRAAKQRQGQATALTRIGSIFERQGRREAAVVRLRDALSLFSKVPDSPAHPDALLTLGRVSAWLGSREEASHLFEQAVDRYSRSHNVQGLSAARIQLGLMRISDGQNQEGLRFLQQAYEDAQRHRDPGQMLIASLALGDGRWIMDDLEAAGTQYEQSLAMVEQRPQASMEAGLRFRLSAIYGVTGQQEKGVEFSRRAVTLYQSLRDPSREAASWSQLASHQQGLGQTQQAEESGQRALSIYKQRQLVVHAIRSSADAPVPRLN